MLFLLVRHRHLVINGFLVFALNTQSIESIATFFSRLRLLVYFRVISQLLHHTFLSEVSQLNRFCAYASIIKRTSGGEYGVHSQRIDRCIDTTAFIQSSYGA